MKWLKVHLEAPEEEWSLDLQMFVLGMEVLLYFCTPPPPPPVLPPLLAYLYTVKQEKLFRGGLYYVRKLVCQILLEDL